MIATFIRSQILFDKSCWRAGLGTVAFMSVWVEVGGCYGTPFTLAMLVQDVLDG
jgi:hypothetical protein